MLRVLAPSQTGAAGLLHHMGQLMGNDLLARRRTRIVFAFAVEYVLAHSERTSVHRAIKFVGLSICMHAYAAEISPEG